VIRRLAAHGGTFAVVTALIDCPPLLSSPAAVRVLATITVTASATAGQGTLTQVDFYANGAWIGVDTSAPYAFSWSGVGTGSYALTARATDSFGAQAMSSGVTVVVGQPPPSTVLGLTITPQPLGAGQTATITVTGTNPCTMLWMDFGDGNWWIAPITSLPFTTTHTWAAPGTYTVLARGYVSCGGEVTKGVTVGSAPMPEALDLAALRSVVTPLAADVEAGEEPPSIRHAEDRWSASAVHEPAVWFEDPPVEADASEMPTLDVPEYANAGALSMAALDDVGSAAEPVSLAPATLHVTLMGSGGGSVSGPGLTCTGALGQTCSGTFEVGDVITLNATASTGTFAGWGGACSGAGACTVTLSSSTLVVATFNVPPPTVTQFYHLDVLGSVRAVTATDGAVLRRHDYAAFGEELHTEEAEAGLPYVAKQQRFTGKERDGESGLDYFAAHYDTRWGRFSTADPGHVGGDIFDPQSWNAYAYARNNPLRFVDPMGTDYYVVVDGGQPFWIEGNQSALHAFETGGFSFRNGFIFNAAGRNVGSYQYFDPVARLAFEIGQRAAPGVNAALALGAAQVTIVAGAASLAGLGGPMVTLGLQAEPILTNQLAGSIIGWGSGQAGAAVTRSLANNLTKATVEQMKRQGLNRATVENLLRQYEKAIAQGGKKLANEQLLPRRELMKKILDLW
jgi:RHS repeat-associated protein